MHLCRALVLVAGAAAAILALAGPAAAESYAVEPVGGPAGYTYKLTCPVGELLVGVAPYWGQHAKPLTGLVAYCHDVGPGQVWGPGKTHPVGKSPSNASYALFCERDTFVAGINLSVTPPPRRIQAVSIYCRRANGTGLFTEMLTPVPNDFARETRECRDNDLIRGLHGARDDFITSVGLLCDAIPGPEPVGMKEQAKEQPCAFCEEEVIANPAINGVALDVCLNWGTNCGQPAADAFCQSRGFARSSAQATQGNAPPTYVMGDSRVCNESFCTRFTSITCNR